MIAKSVIFGFSGTSLTEEEREFFASYNPVGFILFARNIESPEQVKGLVQELRDVAGSNDVLILIDQEGGRVARLGPPYWREAPPAGTFVSLAEQDFDKALEAVYLNHRLIAAELYDLGINVNCAPVLDIPAPGSDAIIGDRAFGTEPENVTALGEEACRGLLEGGVLPVVKHIPGHGRATIDSHNALPVVTTDIDTLVDNDFLPFHELAQMPLAMTAHITYTAIDPSNPATLSPRVIGGIREVIGFDGLLLTDDLSMNALTGDYGERTQQSLDAGCDIVLHCNGKMEEMQAVAEAAVPLSEKAQERLNNALEQLITPEPLDISGTTSHLESLLAA